MINLTALHSYLTTKNEANNFVLILEKLINGLFNDSAGLSEMLSKEVSLELKLIIEKLIHEAKINTDNRKDLQAFFVSMQKEISSLPVIHIMLSIPPKEELVKAIHGWFYQNFQKTILLDISIDPTIIGGGVISFNGRANDYSIRNQVSQMV